MNLAKPTHQAIEDFAEAIAQQYLEESRSQGDSLFANADEFVSEVEFDLKSTLRNRLSNNQLR